MKKWIACLLVISICLGLCACAQQEAASTEASQQPVPGESTTAAVASQQTESTTAETIAQQPVPAVGMLYSFGVYAGSEIQWQVLAVEGEKAFLMSKYALDVQVYHEDWDDTTWETCTLRAWLNDTFMKEAFSDSEQARILTTDVPAEGNPTYPTEAGNTTQDKLFLLSIEQVQTYLTSQEDRKCGVTAYAVERDVWTDEAGHCSWWLRNPGNYGDNAVYITSGGNIDEIGDDVIYADHGIRPVFWIDLNG